MKIEIKKKVKMETKTIRLDLNSLKKLEKVAEKENATLSEVIRTAIEYFFESIEMEE